MVYPALLPLMRTPRLPVVDWTDAPADLNGLVRFVERRNLVSVGVPSHFIRSLRHWQRFVTPALRQRCLAFEYKRRPSPRCDKSAQTRPNKTRACVSRIHKWDFAPYLYIDLWNLIGYHTDTRVLITALRHTIYPNYVEADGKPVNTTQCHIKQSGRLGLKCCGTRSRTGGEVKGKLANGVGSQYPSHYIGTWRIQH